MPLYNTKPVFLLIIPLLMLHRDWMLSFEFPNFLGPYTNDIITYQGDAFASNGTIHLTKIINDTSMPNSVGRASYTLPLRLYHPTIGQASFKTTFSFLMTSNGHSLGDGIAFFIIPYNSSIPESSGGGYLGLFDSFFALDHALQNEVVAVEFDTYSNEWDPPFAHVGIDVNSIKSQEIVKWEIESFLTTVVVATVSYDPLMHKLSVVVISYPEEDTRNITTIILSTEVNLREIMSNWVSIGFSGATGLFTETHKILSWTFSSTMHEYDTLY